MNETKFYVGRQSFAYAPPKLRETIQYAVSIYNEDLRRLNFYFFDVNENWEMRNENPYRPFVLTVYEIDANNKILDTKSLRFNTDLNNSFNMNYHGEPSNLNAKHMDVEVNQRVPVPNTLKLQFVQKNCPLYFNTNYYILLLTEKTTGIRYLELIPSTTSVINSSIFLKSRQRYQYQLYKVHKQNTQFTVTHETGLKSVGTHNTRADVRDLMNLAENHLRRKGSSKAMVRHLYRNKPTTHPTIRRAVKTGIMEKYLKDNNGDPGSSINNKIHGLFFMATPDNTSGQIPDDSFFGNYRIMVPPNYLVDGCRLYFADFTCLRGKSHYITLVLTKANSKEDRYCSNRLVQLDLNDNPFFYRERGVFYVPLTHYLHVEILYTENVDVARLAEMGRLGLLDFRQNILEPHLVKGGSRPGGIPKFAQCEICNLRGIPKSAQSRVYNLQGIPKSAQSKIYNLQGISKSAKSGSQSEVCNLQGIPESAQRARNLPPIFPESLLYWFCLFLVFVFVLCFFKKS